MSEYSTEVKQIAYQLDPECWVSYSGKPKEFKQAMESRRVTALKAAVTEKAKRDISAGMAAEASAGISVGRDLNWEVSADKNDKNNWRVEAVDAGSGEVFIAIFSGPDAQQRAMAYFDIVGHLHPTYG